METKQPVRRLCSEIQLFDLCDLETCRQKDGRYCTNKEALARFEAIQEEDESSNKYLTDEIDEIEEEEAEDTDHESDDYEEDEM